MHEFSLARDLVRLAEHRLPLNGPRSVRRVTVRLGTLSGMTAESLTTAFELASAGTPFEKARLDIEPAEGGDVLLVALEVGE
jgi:Zn finger protein HypA/HybF involved in hydrogenase expression